MNEPTIANLFEDSPWQGDPTLFSDDDINAAADAANAVTPEATGALIEKLLEQSRDRLLDVPILDVLLGGWMRLRSLQALATESMRASSKTHEYEIGRHEVSSTHAPKVELYVHDIKMADAELALRLTLMIASATLMIERGVIKEIALSGLEASAKLSYGPHILLKRKSEKFDFPKTLKLGRGIEIPPPIE